MGRPGRTRVRAGVLTAHAFLLGISWFAIGLPVVLLINATPALGESLLAIGADVPRWLSSGIVATAAVFAFPYFWPAYMVVGGLEFRCATRMRHGDARGSSGAARLLLAQAIGFTLLGVALGLWFRNPPFAAVPLAIAVFHVWLAMWVASAPPR